MRGGRPRARSSRPRARSSRPRELRAARGKAEARFQRGMGGPCGPLPCRWVPDGAGWGQGAGRFMELAHR